MNFLTKRALVLFLLAFTLFACEKPGDIGLDIKNPGQSFEVMYTDTLTVQTSTLLLDSIRSSRVSDNAFILAGQYSDPQLGTVTSNSFFRLYPASDSLNFGQSPVLDSVVLFLRNSYIYGDTNAVQNLTVHLLQDSVQNTLNRPYYRTEGLPYGAAIGSAQSRPGARKTSDTLRVVLDASVGNQILALNGQKEIGFKDGFYGFALIPQSGSPGAVLAFNALNSASRLSLYYKNAASQTQKVFYFGIDGNYTTNQITDTKNDPWNDLQALQPVSSSATSQETLVEGGIGIMTKIDIPHLLKLNENKTIRLNQAYLTVAPVQSKTGSTTPPPTDLILYRSNSNGLPLRSSTGVFIPVEDDIKPVRPRLSSYNTTNNSYDFDITQHLQRVLDNRGAVMPIIYLSLPSFSLDAHYSRNASTGAPLYPFSPASSLETSVSRLILGSQQHPTHALKLRIYYTEIKY